MDICRVVERIHYLCKNVYGFPKAVIRLVDHDFVSRVIKFLPHCRTVADAPLVPIGVALSGKHYKRTDTLIIYEIPAYT
jgi:hypothetical protein